MGHMFTYAVAFLIFFLLEVDACLPAGPMRDIIKHRLDVTNSKVGMADTVTLDATKEKAIKSISEGGMSDLKSVPATQKIGFREITAHNQTSSANSTTISEETNMNATATFKPHTLDDPNFVPGSFLDSDGNTALINPPAVTDILDDFLSRVEQHKSEFGAIAAVLIINVASQMINIIGLIWIVGLGLPLFRHVWEMEKRLPKKVEDTISEALELAHLYKAEPERFTSLRSDWIQKLQLVSKGPSR